MAYSNFHVNQLAACCSSFTPFYARNLLERYVNLSGRIFRQTSYERHLSGSITSLASDLLSNGSTFRDILTPALRAIGCIISIVMLVIGILYVGGGLLQY